MKRVKKRYALRRGEVNNNLLSNTREREYWYCFVSELNGLYLIKRRRSGDMVLPIVTFICFNEDDLEVSDGFSLEAVKPYLYAIKENVVFFKKLAARNKRLNDVFIETDEWVINHDLNFLKKELTLIYYER